MSSANLSEEDSLHTLEERIKTLEERINNIEKRGNHKCATCNRTNGNFVADCYTCDINKRFNELKSHRIYTCLGTTLCVVASVFIVRSLV